MTQISLQEAVSLFQRLGMDTNKLGKTLALHVIADGTHEVLSNLNDDLVMRRTGGLARYVAAALKARVIGPASVTVGLPRGQMGAIIGRVQEQGATIRPKNARMLRIPLPAAQTAAKVDRMAGLRLRETLAPDGSRFFRPRGKMVVGISRGTGKKRHFEAWYVLKSQVTLKPRHWWSSGWKFAASRIGTHADAVVKPYLRGEGVK